MGAYVKAICIVQYIDRIKVAAKTWCEQIPTSTCPQACLSCYWLFRTSFIDFRQARPLRQSSAVASFSFFFCQFITKCNTKVVTVIWQLKKWLPVSTFSFFYLLTFPCDTTFSFKLLALQMSIQQILSRVYLISRALVFRFYTQFLYPFLALWAFMVFGEK